MKKPTTRKSPARSAKSSKAEPAAKVSRSVVPAKFRERYGKLGHNGDKVALTFAGKFRTKDGKIDRTKLVGFAKKNKLWNDKYDGMNVGMIRMNVANRLRAAERKGAKIVW